MIEPFQVWADGQGQHMLVVSSDFHLRLTVGRLATVVPVIRRPQSITSRIPIKDDDGEQAWVLTEKLTTINTSQLAGGKPAWTLSANEIVGVQRALSFMVAL